MSLTELYESRPHQKTRGSETQTRVYLGDSISDFGNIDDSAVIEGKTMYITNISTSRYSPDKLKGEVTYSTKGRVSGNNDRSNVLATDSYVIDIDMMAEQEVVYSVDTEADQTHYKFGGNKIMEFHDEMGLNVMEGVAEGISLYRPAGAITVSATKSFREVTRSYVKTLRDMRCTVNDTSWLIWDEFELLFLGASLHVEGTTSVGITLKFLEGSNIDREIQILDLTETIRVNAFDVLWVQSGRKTTPLANTSELYKVGKINDVYLAKVYKTSDFSQFRI